MDVMQCNAMQASKINNREVRSKVRKVVILLIQPFFVFEINYVDPNYDNDKHRSHG